MENGWPASSWRSSETMMLGDVPMSVMSPPSNEPNAIGMRNTDGDTLERFAIWKATGSIMASAPMFFTKADSTVTTVTSRMSCARTEEMRGPSACSSALDEARARHGGADQQRGGDDDEDVVAESRERLVERHDAHEDGDEQRESGHEVVADASPDEQHHHAGDDREREELVLCHVDTMTLMARRSHAASSDIAGVGR